MLRQRKQGLPARVGKHIVHGVASAAPGRVVQAEELCEQPFKVEWLVFCLHETSAREIGLRKR